MAVSDAIGNQSYIRVPPDSTGKRSATHLLISVEYGTGTVLFQIGDIVYGGTSETHGTVQQIEGNVNTGTIQIAIHPESVNNAFTVGETLLVNGSSKALVISSAEIHYPTAVLAGANNPLNKQYISELGSAHVRFTEGEQLIDAFGLSKVSNPSLADQITFQYDTNSLRFYDNIIGSGSITHLSNSSAVALDVDTASGSLVQRTTHVYYPYHPGFGSLTEMTILCGDTGKDGAVRRWGRFDDNDGVYFELSGSEIYVCQRSSTSGVPVTTKISQSAWNVDKLDGFGNSRLTLNVDKLNLYWIDYAWLGAGQVRFGFYENGTRYVLHRINNSNIIVNPYMKRGNLPFRLETFNETATAGPSRLTMVCASIKNDGINITPENKFGVQRSYINTTAVSASATADTPILLWRGTAYISGTTFRNHYLSVPSTIAGYATEPTVLKLYNFSVVNTASWTQSGTSGLEFGSGATAVDGLLTNTWFVEANKSFKLDLMDFFSFNNISTSKANATPGNIWTFAATSLTPGVSSSIRAGMTWTDIE